MRENAPHPCQCLPREVSPYTAAVPMGVRLLAAADEEAEELSTLRKLLCIGSKDLQEIEVASKGRVFQAAVVDALGAGIDSFSFEDRANVKKAREAVRLDEKLAKKILADTARKCGIPPPLCIPGVNVAAEGTGEVAFPSD